MINRGLRVGGCPGCTLLAIVREGGLGARCRTGITVIVGGGYNGKTTLLDALKAAVYNKVCHSR